MTVDSHVAHQDLDMQIKQLAPQLALDPTAIVELHAIDPIVYVLYLSNSLGRQPVRDKKGKTIIYRSQNAARKELIENGVTTFDFVHMTAYDEIVGMPEWGARQEQRRTVNLESDEY